MVINPDSGKAALPNQFKFLAQKQRMFFERAYPISSYYILTSFP
jgi:hypothetical protein